MVRSITLIVFCALLASAAWLVGGAAGWLYVLCYAAAMVPGLPLGFALFGRDHAAGWIAGAVIGYALTAFAIWAPIAAHLPSRTAFAGAWIAVTALVWFWSPKGSSALTPIPRWTPAGSSALLAVLVLTLAVATPPLAHVGRVDAQGNRYYRAYFTADFVWHTALTSEIAKFSMPPRNPYLARQPIHYYWTYYLLPAAVSETGPAPLRDVQLCLKVNALMTGLLLMSSVFLGAWVVSASPIASGVATALALVASSAEGIFETLKLWARGVPLTELRNWNIDAVTAWPPFGGHRIDGLQRCLWYVPQHSMAYALGVVALVVAGAGGSASPVSAIAIAGVSLGCSVAFNPLVGGIFALTYGVAVVADGWRRPGAIQAIGRHALAAVPVAMAIAWCTSNQMVEGAGGALQFGFLGASRQQPIETLLLSLGPVLIPGVAGVVVARTRLLGAAVPFTMLAVLSLFLMYLVRLSVDQAWMAFRAGQMLIIALAALTARFISAVGSTRRRRHHGRASALLHRRGADDRNRRIQRAGHQQHGNGSWLSLDDCRLAAAAACVRVAPAEHAPAGGRADGCAVEGTVHMEQHSVVRRASHGWRPANLAVECSGIRRTVGSDQDNVRHQGSGRSGQYRSEPENRLRVRR